MWNFVVNLLLFITAEPVQSISRGGSGMMEDMCYEIRLCRLVCPSRTRERVGKGHCVKGGWREEGERVKGRANLGKYAATLR